MNDPTTAVRRRWDDITVPHDGDPRLTAADRAALMRVIEGDEYLEELDATGETIHGYDLT